MIKDGLARHQEASGCTLTCSCDRVRKNTEAGRKRLHCGFGRRRGTANARMPQKELWVQSKFAYFKMAVKVKRIAIWVLRKTFFVKVNYFLL